MLAVPRRVLSVGALLAFCCSTWVALGSTPPVAAAVSAQEAEALRRDDRGVYVAFCPSGEEVASTASVARVRARVSEASHAGWPRDECLKKDKGSYGPSHTLVGLKNVHNWLLGGYGNDTVYGGEDGAVLWGAYPRLGQGDRPRDCL